MKNNSTSNTIKAPVLLFFFNRPNILEKSFDVISQAKPSKIYLACDGPRKNNLFDEKNIQLSKAIVENINWDCDVIRIYSSENIGMYNMFKLALDTVFKNEDRCILLEDDDIVSLSFFDFHNSLLELYKDDHRIHGVCGMNHFTKSENVPYDYFFSKEGSIWGLSLWKRTYDLFYDFEYGEDVYILNLIKKTPNISKRAYRRIKNNYLNNYFYGHFPGPEFFLGLSRILNNSLYIIPKYNLVKNIGCIEDSGHFSNLNKLPKNSQKLFYKDIFEYELPLFHPKYVIADTDYEEKLANDFARNSELKYYIRKIDGLIRRIFFTLIEKIKMKEV